MRRMSLIAAGTLTLGAGLGVSGTALAQDPPADPPTDAAEPAPPVAAATSTTTLPLLGVPLTVDVTTDAGGGLLDVGLGSPDDFIATGVRSNGVSFVNEAGGTKVKVSAKRGGERIEARGGALSDIVGPGGWSGDVFETGATTSVSFEVVDRGDGTPDLVNVAATPATGIEAVVAATEYRTDDDGDATAIVRVEFTSQGQTRTLSVKATVGRAPAQAVTAVDVETTAKLRVSLSRIRGFQQVADAAAGPQSWTGQLCDGPGQIDYVVSETGEISDVVASPEAVVWAKGDRVWVGFSRQEGVAIHTDTDDGTLEIEVADRIRCDRTDPTVNTEIAPDAFDDDRWDDKHRGGRDRDWKHEHDDGWQGRDGDGDWEQKQDDHDGRDGWSGDRDGDREQRDGRDGRSGDRRGDDRGSDGDSG